MADPRGDRPFARLPLPRRGEIVLWNEDCLAGLARRLPPSSVDVIATSPPYNLGIRYGRYRDRLPRSEYLAWIRAFSEAVDRVLSGRGSLFLNVGSPPRDPWFAWDVAREAGQRFVLQNVVHWIKSIAIDHRFASRTSGLTRDLALGHYKPVGSPRFVHGAQEYVFHFSRAGDVPLDRLAIGVPYQDPSNIARWRRPREPLRCRGSTWFLPYPTIQRRARDRPHPATFPPELPEWCVRLHGVARTRRWVDPFVGIGASAVAAARLGIPFVGFDIDPQYLAVARDRARQELTTVRARIDRPTRPTVPIRARSPRRVR
ncbi:MAG: site-specific DNA-methyltransferase [Thermoplasmata archaeon]